MDHTVLTDKQTRQSNYRKWIFALFIAAVATLGIWMLATNWSPAVPAEEVSSGSESVAQTAVDLANPRAADLYSTELDALRRQAITVAGRDEATSFAINLEALAATGRQVYIDSRLPRTPNAYSAYLEGLRRDSVNVRPVTALPSDPNSFSQYLDNLRRMAP